VDHVIYLKKSHLFKLHNCFKEKEISIMYYVKVITNLSRNLFKVYSYFLLKSKL